MPTHIDIINKYLREESERIQYCITVTAEYKNSVVKTHILAHLNKQQGIINEKLSR